MNGNIVDYKIAKAKTMEELEKDVRQAVVSSGWEPIDGAQVTMSPDGKQVVFYQTLVKRSSI